MTGRNRSFVLIAALMLLGACAELPSKTESGGVDAPPNTELVSLCYSAQTTTRQALADIALELCKEGASGVEQWEHDTFFNNCPISKKNRVTYRCLAN